MDKSDYIAKMNAILNDHSKFRMMETEKDKTASIEKTVTKLLRCLKQENAIDSVVFEYTRPSGTVIPRLYGLPKVHKEGLPLRPILDMCDSPYHSTAKWLAKLLEPIRKVLSKHSLRDTFSFVDSISHMQLTGRKMFSLDVVSLFTNVPLEETIDYLCDAVRLHHVDVGLSNERLKQLLLMCTRNVQFLFDGKIYRQKDGVAMGSPLGPLLADVFMSKLENNYLNGVIDKLVYYGRYVDDIFCISDSHLCTDELVRQFNSAHANIKFTLESECNNSMSYLDVQISRRSDGSVQRSVHRKTTWNGQYTHFASFVPLSQKRKLVRCLTERARRICSEDMLSDELNFVRSLFDRNGYPERFVRRNMEVREAKAKVDSVGKKPIYLSLPFKGDGIAESTSRRLSAAIAQTYYTASLRLSFYSVPTLNPQLKDRIPRSSTSFCVYSFSCSCRARYIGRTTRRLSERAREHCPAWLYSGVTRSVASAVSTHLIDSSHQVRAHEAFQPIYRVPRCHTRAVRCRLLAAAEAIAIRLHDPDLCAHKKFVQALTLPWSPVTRTQCGQRHTHTNKLLIAVWPIA
ncbi:unnamed protein product [Dicrocoelium dendriticum]|nr:unnamed protein product [Dicrocoelium dendriticum]